ncbi:MAG: tetratricopeptide repeat protein [Planctomycetes bacterium]|nr:tetratricopeptide repeat protein [Planctomycetota bacterium]
MTVRLDLAIIGFLVLAAAAAYGGVALAEFINLDDNTYIYDNPVVQQGLSARGAAWAFTTLHEANWHPLTWLSHMADCQLFGLWAGGHHLVNLCLHAANGVLVYLLLARMTARRWPSAFVAALFALHPLHVESVAWVAERKDVLSTFLGLLALLSYAWYAARPSLGRYAAVFILLALGLMAKPMLVTLPFVMLLLDFWPLGRLTRNAECGVRNAELTPKAQRFGFSLRTPHSALRIALEKVPLLVLAAASSVITYAAQAEGGAVLSTETLPLAGRLASVPTAYVTYLAKTLWPGGLCVFYPYVIDRPLWQPLASGAALVAATALVIWAARRRALGYLAVGWFWYLGMLVPVIGFVQVGRQSMADRYTYMPLVGIFILVAWGAADVARPAWEGCHAFALLGKHGRFLLGVGRHRLKVLSALAAAALAACLILTWRQVGYWADSETLYRHALEVVADNAVAHGNLGAALAARGRLDDAIYHFREALRIWPESADPHENLGMALSLKGRPEEGLPHLEKAVALRPRRAVARSRLGAALFQLGRNQEAAGELREALRLRPDMVDAHANLSAVLIAQGKMDEAVYHCREALRLRPEQPIPHNNWGLALMELGRPAEALPHLEEALRLRPDYADARGNAGVCLARLGRSREAAGRLREALRLKPDFLSALDELAGICATDPDAALRNGAEAVALAERACALTGRQVPVYLDTLAAAYAEAGRFAEAVAAAQEAWALAVAQGQRDLAARIDARRLAYEAGRPVRRGTGPPASAAPAASLPRTGNDL